MSSIEKAGVITHPEATRVSVQRLRPRPPRTTLIPTIAPITACELETGTSGTAGRPWERSHCSSPLEAKRKSTSDSARTTIRAMMGVSLKSSLPTVAMTRKE